MLIKVAPVGDNFYLHLSQLNVNQPQSWLNNVTLSFALKVTSKSESENDNQLRSLHRSRTRKKKHEYRHNCRHCDHSNQLSSQFPVSIFTSGNDVDVLKVERKKSQSVSCPTKDDVSTSTAISKHPNIVSETRQRQFFLHYPLAKTPSYDRNMMCCDGSRVITIVITSYQRGTK